MKWKARLRTCNAYRTICGQKPTTIRRMKVWKRESAKGWKKFEKSGHAQRAVLPKGAQKAEMKLNPAPPHLISQWNCQPEGRVCPSQEDHVMASSGITVRAGPDTVRVLPTHSVQELLKLQKAAQKINSILDLDQLIDKIANDIACSFGCVELNVFLYEPDRSEMVLAGVHGCTLHGKGHRLKVGKEGMVGYVAATGQMRYAPDVRLDPY